MKIKLNLISFLFLFNCNFSFGQFQPAIVQDWADYIGYQDTIIRIPVLQNSYDHIITAGFTVDSITGPDIMVAAYKETSQLIWQRTYSSPGYNRDQATALAIDDSNNVYVAGSVFSSTTNYDFVLLKYDTAGVLKWSAIYNGTANNYDVPSAIAVRDSFVYVTGAVNNAGTLLDFVTIQYNKYTGAQNWVRTYDYATLFDIPIAIVATNEGSVYTTGGSQETVTDWDYVVLTYDHTGAYLDTLREAGAESGFARVNAVKNDSRGNFYITGAEEEDGEGSNIKTIKINSGDTIEWIAEFKGDAHGDDEGYGLTIDDLGNVYVCGKTFNSTLDFFVIKYDSLGNEIDIWTYDSESDDKATAICTDAFGNIVVTGTVQKENEIDTIEAPENLNFLTVALNTNLEELWRDFFDGTFQGNDYATNIIADNNGNLYVTGQSQIDAVPTYQQITIKYRTDYFVFPEDTATTPKMLFYPNLGQIMDTEGNPTSEELGSENPIFCYSLNQFPKIYFHRDSVSFVMASVSDDTVNIDTLERISMNFVDGYMTEAPLGNTIHDTDQVLNYFLGHCPEGITGVTGSEKLVYSNVYENTDVVFLNNAAGMKFQIIFHTGAIHPESIQLRFTGHESLEIVNTSDLKINGLLGSFIYERPLVYQIDEEGVRIPLGWLASYNIISAEDISFTLGGAFDPEQTLVIECARQQLPLNTATYGNLEWCAYYGDDNWDACNEIATDNNGSMYSTGITWSGLFPHTAGVFQAYLNGIIDAYVNKFENLDELKWSTFYGGSSADYGYGITVDANHDIFFVGHTMSGDFPVNATLSSTTSAGSQIGEYPSTTGDDAFIVKLSPDGASMIWANFIGSQNIDRAYSVALLDNYVYIVGNSGTDNNAGIFPIVASTNSGAYNQTNQSLLFGDTDGFILKLNKTTGLELWGTYFSGAGLDALYSVKAAGSRIFVSGLTECIYYSDVSCGLATNGGMPYCFPVGSYNQNFGGGVLDTYIAEFDGNDNLIWGTFVGGNGKEGHDTGVELLPIFESGNGNYTLYFCTNSSSSNGPFTTNHGVSFNQSFQGGGILDYDAVVIKFVNRQIVWSSWFGGNGDDSFSNITRDAYKTYIIGRTSSAVPCSTIDYCAVPPVDEFPLCNSIPTYFFQSSYQNFINDGSNIFLCAFDNTDDNLVWSTYFGECQGPQQNGMWRKMGIAFTPITEQLYIGANSRNHNSHDFPIYFRNTGSPWNQSTNVGPGTNDAIYARFNASTLVGINEYTTLDDAIVLFPNPAGSQIEIEYKNLDGAKLVLYNSSGQVVKMQNNTSVLEGRLKFDVSNLSEGLYVFNLILKDGKTISKKFAIQR